ncbi:MAG: prepilin-type N-terminal cleavage/methylation domain-containing protein [Oligoflexia bacterium]|nr:prepilin-type N-terminal cleavage/methylation domain-containing protein [Oligoflexia bacterium]
MRKQGLPGFTLNEMMVAIAVSSLVFLGVASVFTMITRLTQNARALADMHSLEGMIIQRLANPQTCASLFSPNPTLAPVQFPGYSGTPPVHYGQTYNPATAYTSVNLVGAGSHFFALYNAAPSTTMASVLVADVPSNNPSPGGNNNVFGSIQVMSLSLDLLTHNTSMDTTFADVVLGQLHLQILKTLTSGQFGGNAQRLNGTTAPVPTDIFIPVSLEIANASSPGMPSFQPVTTLVSCAAAGASNLNQLTPPTCTSDQHLFLDLTNPTDPLWGCK